MKPISIKSALLVDDEPGIIAALAASFRLDGWMVETAHGFHEAVRKLHYRSYSLLVTDVQMPDGNGLDLMRQARQSMPEAAVIVLTAYATVPEAVNAIQDGACDYLTKPVSYAQLRDEANRLLSAERRKKQPESSTTEILGNSPALERSLQRARLAARTAADVLIESESGTGKELLARFIHEASDRRNAPFVAVNCAAVPEHLLESELFGHARGAFTGATQNRVGKFALADRGTLLLDEIGEMPLVLQPKLLRALQERQFEPLGDSRTVSVDVRIIATTNVSLLDKVGQGKFRADLFYRLNVIPIGLPPLRERRDDIPLLATHFATVFSKKAGKPVPQLSEEFLDGLMAHDWPGNIRELANFICRVVTLSELRTFDGRWLEAEYLPRELHSVPVSLDTLPGKSIREMERTLLVRTLEATKGNRTRTAEMLGVSLRTVRNRIREYQLPPRSVVLQ